MGLAHREQMEQHQGHEITLAKGRFVGLERSKLDVCNSVVDIAFVYCVTLLNKARWLKICL